MKLVDSFLRTSGDVHVLHFEAQISFRNQPMCALVDLSFELWVKFDAELLGILFHIIENFYTFQDRLIFLDMFYALHEILDFELLLKLKMRYFRFVSKFHINIGLVVLDLSDNFVQILIIISFNSLTEFVLSLLDVAIAVSAEADWSFFLKTIFIFVDPVTSCTKLTPELAAILAVVLDVSEIEFGSTAFLAVAVTGLNTLSNECPCFWMCGKINWSMFPCIL